LEVRLSRIMPGRDGRHVQKSRALNRFRFFEPFAAPAGFGAAHLFLQSDLALSVYLATA
jgi:hypothetical protein